MTGPGRRPPEAVLAALGLDTATDEIALLDPGHLPRTIPLYVTTLIGPVDDPASARHVHEVLARSLPPTADVAALTVAGERLPAVAQLSDLDGLEAVASAWVVLEAADVRLEAVGALYAADLLDAEQVETEHLSRRAAALAVGTWAHRDDLDAIIGDHAREWRVDRLNAVDRTILRLGTYELRHTDLATGIVVDRAVELAKRFSTSRSGAFVNGVLDAIAAHRGDDRVTPPM